MARPRKVTSFNSAQAQFILERAIADRKLSSSDVNRYLGAMHEEISALEPSRKLAQCRRRAGEAGCPRSESDGEDEKAQSTEKGIIC